MRHFSHIGISVLAIALSGAGAHAQTAGTASAGAPAEAGDQQTGIADIIVTAQRRGQNLQDVPLSVAAFSGENLEATGVKQVGELARVDPALNINQGSGVVTPFLRGVGNPSASVTGNEASVPVYIDEVYYTRLSPAYLNLANIERVEVLKGPQGTLFGRNSSGGLIHIITPEPGDRTEVRMQFGAANYETFTGQLYAAGPITDNLAVSLSATGRIQRDGWGTNLFDGQDVLKDNFSSFRAKLVYTPGPSTKITLSGFYVRQLSDVGLTTDRLRGTVGGTPPFYGTPEPLPPQAYFYDTNNNVRGYARHRGGGGSAKISQKLGPVELVSITAYRTAKDLYRSEGDFSYRDFLNYDLNQVDNQFTQEFQVKSGAGSPIDFIVGAYYLYSKQGYNPTVVRGDAFGPGNSLDIFGIQTVRSYSAYGQATIPLLSTTNATVGLRYTSDDVHGEGSQQITLAGVGTFPFLAASGGQDPYSNTTHFKKLTYKFGLDHHFTDDIMVYGSVSRGYKAGTFNTLPLNTVPAQPETVDSYEVGLKASFFDNRVRANIAVFQNDIKNPQVLTIIPSTDGLTTFIGLTNAQKARIRGVEGDLTVSPAHGLTLRAAATYLDPKYTQFNNAPFNDASIDPATGQYVPPYGLLPVRRGDATGYRMAQVPKFRGVGGINYVADLDAGKLTLDASVSYTGSFPWDADNRIYHKEYALVDASIAFSPASFNSLTVRIWGKNLTGKEYYISHNAVNSGNGDISGAGAPRTYGIEFGWSF